jgi:hypothetical protein
MGSSKIMKNKEEEKILKWRLAEKPTAQALQDLVKSQIITKEEARQILLDEGEYTSKDIQEIKDEIALLRKLVLETSNGLSVIKIIEREVPTWKPYWSWTNPYMTYCSSNGNMLVGNGTTTLQGTNAINVVAKLN